MQKSNRLLAAAALMLAACSDNSGSGSMGGSGSSGGVATAETMPSFVQMLFSTDTSGMAAPIDLATVTLDTSSQDPSDYASLFPPSTN